jgi:shikimate kinase
MNKGNIVLIGMPGVGKSTTGIVLSKVLKKPFIDTDLIIQQKENLTLQNIIDKNGIKYFYKAEEKIILDIEVNNHVISTGGSVVYSNSSILHLRKKEGIIIYLQLRFDEIQARVNNIKSRGIPMANKKTLLDIYKERKPLYEKYADIEISCSEKDLEDVVEEIVEKIYNLK